ncbi:acetyl-CoA carboxylase biotin carboxyl carrier protein subunit [uncultured Psychrobacter sp.]|uniref:acetyl-CoA carboxylase biotin carboxyl carrier protein n=1 Tax=uncultured Psychrobacter sp. TaxID=259303 RepID=UPI0034594486
MDITAVERLVTLVESSQVHKITIEDHDQSISVVNRSHATKSPTQNNIDSSLNSTRDKNTSSFDTNNQDLKDLESVQVLSPYVGYMHLSADGATDNLMKKGDAIEVEQTIGFVEVLTKLLPIISDKSGVVSEVLVEEGQVVEYGQPILQLAE